MAGEDGKPVVFRELRVYVSAPADEPIVETMEKTMQAFRPCGAFKVVYQRDIPPSELSQEREVSPVINGAAHAVAIAIVLAFLAIVALIVWSLWKAMTR